MTIYNTVVLHLQIQDQSTKKSAHIYTFKFQSRTKQFHYYSRDSKCIGKGKGKVLPITGHKGPEGEQIYSSTLPLTSTLDGGWLVSTTPRPLYPRQRPGTHCVEGWVGPRAGLDGCGKSRRPPEFDPRIFQSVASRASCFISEHRQWLCRLTHRLPSVATKP